MWKLITVVTINAKTKVSDYNKNNKNQEQPIYESSESSESNDYSATTCSEGIEKLSTYPNAHVQGLTGSSDTSQLRTDFILTRHATGGER